MLNDEFLNEWARKRQIWAKISADLYQRKNVQNLSDRFKKMGSVTCKLFFGVFISGFCFVLFVLVWTFVCLFFGFVIQYFSVLS